MIVATTRAELARARGDLPGRVAVVMTMGALHEGHVRLLQAARKLADTLVLTIFVNPLQFGDGEDLDRYPRTLADDLAVAEREGVDLTFTPSQDTVYPEPPLVRVTAGPLGEVLFYVSQLLLAAAVAMTMWSGWEFFRDVRKQRSHTQG